jgi:hypothetical protein
MRTAKRVPLGLPNSVTSFCQAISDTCRTTCENDAPKRESQSKPFCRHDGRAHRRRADGCRRRCATASTRRRRRRTWPSISFRRRFESTNYQHTGKTTREQTQTDTSRRTLPTVARCRTSDRARKSGSDPSRRYTRPCRLHDKQEFNTYKYDIRRTKIKG